VWGSRNRHSTDPAYNTPKGVILLSRKEMQRMKDKTTEINNKRCFPRLQSQRGRQQSRKERERPKEESYS
jgi:hypothetical protein